MKRNCIVIHTQVYLLLPVFILLLPDKWILSWVAAALIHEGFHLMAIRLFNIKILKIEIGIFGAKIEIETMDRFKELIVALAGPVGALLTLVFSRYIPQISICIITQTAYNLLPVYPLDGGRVLRCLLVAKMEMNKLVFAEKSVLYTITVCCIIASIFLKLGILPIVLGLSLLMKYKNANIPCKQYSERVQ